MNVNMNEIFHIIMSTEKNFIDKSYKEHLQMVLSTKLYNIHEIYL